MFMYFHQILKCFVKTYHYLHDSMFVKNVNFLAIKTFLMGVYAYSITKE